MFTNTFVALLAFAAPFLVRADCTPTLPAPGTVYNEGSTCLIAWDGDTSSTTLWKNMAIELMTGNNFEMEFITTVATGQDGTVSGRFSYPCPQVTPNSAIYFYQFDAPDAVNTTWTGRFTIASSTGQTTPPANSIQPDDSDIPWGIGALVNPSKAILPPTFADSNVLSSSTASNSSSLPSVANSATSSATPVLATVVTSASVIPSSTPTQSKTTSGAMTGFDIRVLGAAAAAAASLTFSFVW